eukprot:3746714-Amphidinium_carterae.1
MPVSNNGARARMIIYAKGLDSAGKVPYTLATPSTLKKLTDKEDPSRTPPQSPGTKNENRPKRGGKWAGRRFLGPQRGKKWGLGASI